MSTALSLHSVSRQRSLHAGAVELELREKLSWNAVIVAILYYEWRCNFHSLRVRLVRGVCALFRTR